MKWNNLTQEEAQEGYDDAKSRYTAAAELYCRYQSELDECGAEYSQIKGQYDDVNSDKVNFEKRIEDIRKLLKMLDSGGKCGEAVEEANSASKKTEDHMAKCIHCDGIPSPALGSAFRSPPSGQDSYTANAIRVFKNEISRLESSIKELDAKLNSIEQSTQELINKMNFLTGEAAGYKKQMTMSAFEMCHYKKYT